MENHFVVDSDHQTSRQWGNVTLTLTLDNGGTPAALSRAFRGAVYQKAGVNRGAGFFPGIDETGAVELVP